MVTSSPTAAETIYHPHKQRRSASAGDIFEPSPLSPTNLTTHHAANESRVSEDRSEVISNTCYSANAIPSVLTNGSNNDLKKDEDEENDQPSFDLSATLHKRRGGLGWNVEKNWVPRFFTLYGSILCYYESPDFKSADPSRPRNRIDLSKEGTLVEKLVKQKPGAPYEYLIILNLFVPIGAKRRWEMCFKTHEQQIEWYEALRQYDGKPEHPAHRKSKNRHFDDDEEDVDVGVLMRTNEPIVSKVKKAINRNSIKTKSGRVHVLSIPLVSFNLNDVTILISVIIFNTLPFAMRFGSSETFWFSIVAANLTISYLCAHIMKLSQYPINNNNNDDDDSYDEMLIQATNSDDMTMTLNLSPTKAFNTILESGSTIERAKPKSALLKEIMKEDRSSPTFVKACASPSTEYEQKPHTYWNADASRFNLRIGPNYKKNKQKAPSAPSLFNLYEMDLIKAKTVLIGVEQGFRVPDIPGVTNAPTGHPFVPPMIILTVNIPSEAPNVFQNTTGGPSYIAVMYYIISEDTKNALADLENASSAVKLLAHWCEHAETDDVCKGRFKFMAVLDDIESLGLPGFITRFNGKPILINKSGTLKRHENYIEMSVNVHSWVYMARKGLHVLLPKFPEMIVNIGATIEGRNDEEQPECLLGGVRVQYLDPDKITVDGSS